MIGVVHQLTEHNHHHPHTTHVPDGCSTEFVLESKEKMMPLDKKPKVLLFDIGGVCVSKSFDLKPVLSRRRNAGHNSSFFL